MSAVGISGGLSPRMPKIGFRNFPLFCRGNCREVYPGGRNFNAFDLRPHGACSRILSAEE